MSALQTPVVAVVDDDEPMCMAVARSLRRHGFHVHTYTSALQYLQERDTIDPQCVLVDISMPELDGVGMHRAEREKGYDVPTVFITGHADVRTAVRAMKDGAMDLLEKPVDEALLVRTVRHAIDRSSALRAAESELTANWHALDLLTRREAEVCALVASGQRNKQIAALIGITEKTVKVHRARVMEKLAVESLADLVRLVDRVLGDASAGALPPADRRALTRPRALDVMTSALATAAAARVERDSRSREKVRLLREAAIAAETYY